MSDSAKNDEKHGEGHVHVVPLRVLFGVWAALVVLTWITVGATRLDLGNGNIAVALLIAVLKASVVALYFMHLRYDRPFNGVIFVSATVFVTLFIGLTLMDTKENKPSMIPGYAPAIAASATAAGASSAAAPAGPGAGLTGIARGEALYAASCIACHGKDGQGMRELHSPALHHQEPWYIVSQLEKFRAGLRGTHPADTTGAQMRPMAVALPDEQALKDVAEYVVSLDAPEPPFTIEADVAAGEAYYHAICVTCHGPDGMGMSAVRSPAIVGQSDWYVAAQLRKFRAGVRGADPKDVTGLQMRAMSLAIPGDDMIDNLAAYVSRLGR